MEVTRRAQSIGEGKDPSGLRWRSSILGACTVSPQGALIRGPLPGSEALGSGRNKANWLVVAPARRGGGGASPDLQGSLPSRSKSNWSSRLGHSPLKLILNLAASVPPLSSSPCSKPHMATTTSSPLASLPPVLPQPSSTEVPHHLQNKGQSLKSVILFPHLLLVFLSTFILPPPSARKTPTHSVSYSSFNLFQKSFQFPLRPPHCTLSAHVPVDGSHFLYLWVSSIGTSQGQGPSPLSLCSEFQTQSLALSRCVMLIR
ncbi:uncharacterized protein LOC115838055 [Nomascus leucogenys]|uniref:uncharacterized protein LOC115838055 n=1 Tax=Nomascus leucogenys TaxID=61853 RepID=UPI00122D94BB|nr:uncharacterized protein LOC115838055 [Nomascus leucogenys]